MYQLIIHHDVGVVKKEGHLEIDKDSPGHVYLELKENDNSVVYGVLSGVDLDLSDLKKTYNSYQKYIVHGQERLKLAREYEDQNSNNKILHSKTIKITEEQYLKGIILLAEYKQYMGKEIPSEIYGLGNNCTHFVNHIYRSMGLEGDYTRNYRESELNQINTKLTNSYKTLFGLHAGDKPLTVFGSAIEEIAKQYNIDTSKIAKKEPIRGISDIDAVMMQDLVSDLTFEIAPNSELIYVPQGQGSVSTEATQTAEDLENKEEIISGLSAEEQWELNSRFRQQVMHTIFSPSEKQFTRMEELLAQGADINGGEELLGQDGYFCCYGYPAPLLLAANSSEAKVVEFLLNKGANPNIIDNRSTRCLSTPALYSAVRNNNLEIVKLLLNANADVNLRDNAHTNGNTALELSFRMTGEDYKNTSGYLAQVKILKALNIVSDKLQRKLLLSGDQPLASEIDDYSSLLNPVSICDQAVPSNSRLLECIGIQEEVTGMD